MSNIKATVQYNDFIGTSAADISDHNDLNAYLKVKGVDTDRYNAIGASFYHGYAHSFYASIICIDREQSSDENEFLTEINISEITHNEFFDLFKRFHVVIHDKHGNYENRKINDIIHLEDNLEETDD